MRVLFFIGCVCVMCCLGCQSIEHRQSANVAGLEVAATFIPAKRLAERKLDLDVDQLKNNTHILLEFVNREGTESPIAAEPGQSEQALLQDVFFGLHDNVWIEWDGVLHYPRSIQPEFTYGMSGDMDYFLTFDIPETALQDLNLHVNDQVFASGTHAFSWNQ